MDGLDTYPNQMRNSDPRLINFKMPIKTKDNNHYVYDHRLAFEAIKLMLVLDWNIINTLVLFTGTFLIGKLDAIKQRPRLQLLH